MIYDQTSAVCLNVESTLVHTKTARLTSGLLSNQSVPGRSSVWDWDGDEAATSALSVSLWSGRRPPVVVSRTRPLVASCPGGFSLGCSGTAGAAEAATVAAGTASICG